MIKSLYEGIAIVIVWFIVACGLAMGLVGLLWWIRFLLGISGIK